MKDNLTWHGSNDFFERKEFFRRKLSVNQNVEYETSVLAILSMIYDKME